MQERMERRVATRVAGITEGGKHVTHGIAGIREHESVSSEARKKRSTVTRRKQRPQQGASGDDGTGPNVEVGRGKGRGKKRMRTRVQGGAEAVSMPHWPEVTRQSKKPPTVGKLETQMGDEHAGAKLQEMQVW